MCRARDGRYDYPKIRTRGSTARRASITLGLAVGAALVATTGAIHLHYTLAAPFAGVSLGVEIAGALVLAVVGSVMVYERAHSPKLRAPPLSWSLRVADPSGT
jgi:hypothetical protein